MAATLHELVDALVELAAVDKTSRPLPGKELPLLLNAIEAGRLLSLSRSKVLDLAARGRIPSIRIGGSVRIPRDFLLDWIAKNSAHAILGWSAPGQSWSHPDRTADL